MTPQQKKADNLVNQFRIVLMREDTECGNEILCTRIAKDCALIFVNEILTNSIHLLSSIELYYWNEVKQELEKL